MKKGKKVIIYGGAFNPPTKAHHAILEALVKIAKENGSEIWIVPSGERPDKAIGIGTDMRLALCQALLKSVENHDTIIRLIDFELLAQTETNTLDSSTYLEKTYPDHIFTWVFGSDSIKTMRTWPGGEQLFSTLNMLIVPRPHYELTSLPPRARVIPAVKASPESSTQVREKLKRGHSVDHLTPEHVAKLLGSTSLY